MGIIFEKNTTYKILIDNYDFDAINEKKYFERAGKKITEISFSAKDFFCDILTCGMPQFYLNRSAFSKRLEELKYKIYLIRASLEIDSEGYVIVSDNIKYLDASEKVFVSYYIGMFITKLISREVFNYDYLVHYGIVKRYKRIGKDKDDKREPDLIAFYKRADEYSIFEAKGRQSVKNSLITSAKAQIKAIKSISGLMPDLGVVSVTHPIKEGNRIKCSMYDPKISNEEKGEVAKEELLHLYYYPIYELIRENLIGTSSCEFELELEDGVIKCNINMDNQLFSYFNQCSDMRKQKNSEYERGLKKIVDALSDNEKDVIISVEWMAE